MSKYELDDAAYEALKAHPAMVEEAMTNQDGAFWAKFTNLINKGSDTQVASFIAGSIDEYVKESVEEFADTWELPVNQAIHKLLNRCNGGK